MKVHVLFFASLRDHARAGEREIELSLPTTVRELFVGHFSDQDLAQRLLPSVRFAVNCEYVAPETIVKEGDEVGFIPPVSGG